MNRKTRSVLAYILSPLAGVLVCQLFVVSHVMWPLSSDVSRIMKEFTLGITPLLLIYILLVITSIPVFFVIRYAMGRNMGTCFLSSAGTVVVLWALLAIGGPIEGKEYFTNLQFIGGAIVGTSVYEYLFWVLSGKIILRK